MEAYRHWGEKDRRKDLGTTAVNVLLLGECECVCCLYANVCVPGDEQVCLHM